MCFIKLKRDINRHTHTHTQTHCFAPRLRPKPISRPCCWKIKLNGGTDLIFFFDNCRRGKLRIDVLICVVNWFISKPEGQCQWTDVQHHMSISSNDFLFVICWMDLGKKHHFNLSEKVYYQNFVVTIYR